VIKVLLKSVEKLFAIKFKGTHIENNMS
jgi:hypothetical protein